MKKIIALAMFCMLFKGAYSQDEDWINRVTFEPTEQCIDSLHCYTQVVVQINPAVVPDSATMWLKIGTTYGAGDIYSKRYQKTPSMFELPEVAADEHGIIVIGLGQYLISGDFFVDMSIEQ